MAIGYYLDFLSNPTGKNITVEGMAERYLSTKTDVKLNALANYKFVKNLMKKEPFNGNKISQVKTSDAKMFLIKLQQDGRRYSTIKTVRGGCGSLFRWQWMMMSSVKIYLVLKLPRW